MIVKHNDSSVADKMHQISHFNNKSYMLNKKLKDGGGKIIMLKF